MRRPVRIQAEILTVLMAFLAFTVINVRADEPEKDHEDLKVAIRTYDGETVLVREGCPFYSAVPVTFKPEAEGAGCYYCYRVDKEEDFGSYIQMDGEELTLYPDDENNPGGNWEIKFRSVVKKDTKDAHEDGSDDDSRDDDSAVYDDAPEREGGLEETVKESPVYNVIFDVNAPTVEAADPEAVTGWFNDGESIGFIVSDDKSGIGRIIMRCNGKVIKELHPDENTGGALSVGGEVSFPVRDTGSSNNEAEIECFDLAGNANTVCFEYNIDGRAPTVRLEGIEDGSYHTDGAVLVISADDPDSEAYVNYTIERQYEDEEFTNEVTNAGKSEEISFTDDGRYNVRAWSADSAGNTSEESCIGFVIDTEPPVIDIGGTVDNVDIKDAANITIDIGEKIYQGSMVDINLSRTILDRTEVIHAENYEMEATHETRQVNISSDGEYELCVCATDGAGNRTDAVKHFRIDKTPPEISVSGIGEGEVTADKPVLRFGAGELFYESTVLSTILEKKEKGGYVNVESKDRVMTSAKDHVDVKTPGEGQYRLTCIAADRSGNTSGKSVNFTVDYTPPVIADMSDMDNKFFRAFSLPKKAASLVSDATKVSVDAYVNDNRIDDEDTIIEEGKYVLNILAEDEAGNVSDGQATFIVDHTAPQIVLTGCDRDGNVKKGSLLTVSLLEDGDTLKSVKFNGRSIVIGKDNRADIVVDDYGDYTIAVVAEDEAGNVTDTKIHTGCYMIGKTVDGYLKGTKTITLSSDTKDEGDVDLTGIFIGLASVVGGTLGLSYRALFRQ